MPGGDLGERNGVWVVTQSELLLVPKHHGGSFSFSHLLPIHLCSQDPKEDSCRLFILGTIILSLI